MWPVVQPGEELRAGAVWAERQLLAEVPWLQAQHRTAVMDHVRDGGESDL
jgi:hypothetical protein